MHYYNEWDPYVAQWLRNLIEAGILPEGLVDERDIREVKASDLAPFTQCHFFAGIGGWPYALQLAGWATTEPVWTASLPCQPFSDAGRGRGTEDERHLFPVFRELVAQCKPSVLFGEQVASKAGRLWLNDLRTELEALGYAIGAGDLCAAGVGAAHIRQRLYWVADSNSGPASRMADSSNIGHKRGGAARGRGHGFEDSGTDRRMGNPNSEGLEGRGQLRESGNQGTPRQASHTPSSWANGIWIKCTDDKQRLIEPSIQPLAHGVSNRVGRLRAYGNAIVPQVAQEFIRSYMEVSQ
jgi:DNA (cytosine-5)-methyltransferase 1